MTRRLSWVLIYAVLVFACIVPISTGQAQITKTARVELNNTQTSFHIGSYSYITKDPERKLNKNIIASRHENNLRGQRSTGNQINLGTDANAHWIVFSVTNTSSTENWILDFGRAAEGRQAIVNKIAVYNYTTGDLVTRALREKNYIGGFGEDFFGSALPLKIKQNKTALFVVYIETDSALLNTLSPRLLSEDHYIHTLQTIITPSNIWLVLFAAAISGFAVNAFLKREPKQLWLSVYFVAHGFLFLLIDQTFFASYALTGEIIAGVYILAIISVLPVIHCVNKFTIDHYSQNFALFSIGIALAAVALLNIVFLRDHMFLYTTLIFGLGLCGLGSAVVFSILNGRQGHVAGYYMAGAWCVAFVGLFLTALSAISVLPAHTIILNMYWIFVIGQAPIFMVAFQKHEEEAQAKKVQAQSRENRAAQSMERLRRSKESADQTRLLRVIDRERELMTELREREIQRTEEMRQAKDMADQANRAKSAFLAVVSHEIRTPMTGILGMVRLLMDTQLNIEQEEYAAAIQKSGDTMMTLLNDILDFEKIETGAMDLEHIDFDMIKLIQVIVTLMSGNAINKNLTLRSNLDDRLPRYLVGDPTRLRQILLNLINNAIKFTEKGHVEIRVEATGTEPAEGLDVSICRVKFSVEDTGIGISQKAQKNLFDPFAQADSTVARKYGGTGLGLAICRRLVEAMGGEIEIDSQEEMGSTFYFSIEMPIGY